MGHGSAPPEPDALRFTGRALSWRGIPAISSCSHGNFAPPPFDVNAAKGQLFNSLIWSN